MKKLRRFSIGFLLITVLSLSATSSLANGPSEYQRVVHHLKARYKAKKVKIPFLWLARFAVSVARPAGVKSFSVTFFKDLKITKESLDSELRSSLDRSFAESWSPVFRVRSREGQYAYMYMQEAGTNIRIALVTIDKENAAIIRATFSPEKLVEFTNDPKIFGISLKDGAKPAELPPTPADHPAKTSETKN